jgi:CelD/BcsL family acetyltransferase involved in cellulose biosynthesis
MQRMLRSDPIELEADIAAFLPAWDELALSCRRPYGTPAWMMAWWRHMAPPGAQLRVLAVRDGEDLVGLAAMYVAAEARGVRHARLLAARYGGTPLGPIARPGAEEEVARLLGAYLGDMRPAPQVLHFDGIPTGSPWPALIRSAWSGAGRPMVQRDAQRPTPTIRAAGMTFDQWMAAKSKNFRQEMRRKRRQLEDRGAVIRMSETLEEVDQDLDAFIRLHGSRWDWRGGSGRLKPATKDFLIDLASQLLPLGRYRLWSIDVNGESISTHLFVCGGGRANYWLGGFDDAWSRYSPAMVTLLAGVEHALGAGDTEIGLGAGRQEYKSRFTSEAEQLDWLTLVPSRSLASPRVWAGVVPGLASRGVSNRVSSATKERLKSIVKRGAGS